MSNIDVSGSFQPLNEREILMLRKLLGDTFNYPPEFWNAIKTHLEQDPPLIPWDSIGGFSTAVLRYSPDPALTRVKVKQVAAQSIPDNTFTTLTWDASDTEIYDPHNMHDPSTNPGRLTVQTGDAGLWEIIAQYGSANPAENGLWQVQIRKNGTDIIAGTSGSGQLQNAAIHDEAIVGDYYEMRVYQSHGPSPGNLNTADPTSFGMTLVTP